MDYSKKLILIGVNSNQNFFGLLGQEIIECYTNTTEKRIEITKDILKLANITYN